MAKKRRRSTHKGGQRTASRPVGASAAKAADRAGHADGEASKRQARKEEARRQREDLRKRMVRRKRLRQGGIALGVVAVASVIALLVANGGGSSNPGPLTGLLTTKAPWGANNAKLTDRLKQIGIPALTSGGAAVHIHQHLDIFVHGTSETVPAQIGITSDGSLFSPLHTHDTTGVMHVESNTQRTFTLGEFFEVWGVRLNATCLGGYCNSGGNKLTAYVNGKQVTGDPASIKLAEHQEIVLAYGTTSELPNPIPSSYTFPAGE